MTSKPTLATVLAGVAIADAQAASRADAVLSVIGGSGIRGLKAFSASVRDAYRANGWNATAGRPGKGSAGNAVPKTVKQYVSRVRKAFRLDLPVHTFKNFYALRKALAAARPAKPKKRQDKRMAGLRVIRGGEMIGAPFHDLTVLYEVLEGRRREQLVASVNRLVKDFRPAATPVLELRKAA